MSGSPPACALFAALAMALLCSPAGAAEGSGPAERAAAKRAAAAGPGAGVAGVDRFSIDSSRIERSERADGLIVVRLNGEGMERSQLQLVDGRPVARCTSALDPARLRRDSVPADFRDRKPGPAVSHD